MHYETVAADMPRPRSVKPTSKPRTSRKAAAKRAKLAQPPADEAAPEYAGCAMRTDRQARTFVVPWLAERCTDNQWQRVYANPWLGRLPAAGPNCPAVSTATLVLGDFSKFVIRVAKPIFMRLEETYAQNHQVGFLAFTRVDSNIVAGGGTPIVYLNTILGACMFNTQTGTVAGVHAKHIFIANERYSTIYAHRNALRFTDPYIGLQVKFELDFRPEMRDPVAGNVRRHVSAHT